MCNSFLRIQIWLVINKINKALILSADNYQSNCFALNFIKFALAKKIKNLLFWFLLLWVLKTIMLDGCIKCRFFLGFNDYANCRIKWDLSNNTMSLLKVIFFFVSVIYVHWNSFETMILTWKTLFIRSAHADALLTWIQE